MIILFGLLCVLLGMIIYDMLFISEKDSWVLYVINCFIEKDTRPRSKL